MKSHVTAGIPPQRSASAQGSRNALTSEEACAEDEPHVSCGRLKYGGAGGAYDAAKDVGAEREFILQETGIINRNTGVLGSFKFTGRFKVHKRSIVCEKRKVMLER